MVLRIKEVIKEKNLTIEQIAEVLGINRVTLSRAINGNPTVETLQRIATVLQVDIRDLFGPGNISSNPLESLKEIRSIAENAIKANHS